MTTFGTRGGTAPFSQPPFSQSLMPPVALLVVLEKQPYWVPELRRQFLKVPLEVRSCRTLHDAGSCLGSADLLLLVLDEPETVCLNLLEQLAGEDGRRPIIAVTSDKNAEWEWAFREAGVWAFLTEPFDRDEVALLCRRILAGTTAFGRP